MNVNTFGGFPLYQSNLVREARRRFRYDEVPELELANSFWMSGGKYPSRGWLLMRQYDYNRLQLYYPQDLVIQDFAQVNPPNPKLTLHNIVIVQARCVSRGRATDPDSIYLVEVTDQRGILWNPWVNFPTLSQYNINAPAYPGTFYTQSMNAGVPWTWNTMVGDLWNQMSTQLGFYTVLPIIPPWTPESWSFPGTSAWEALNTILTYLGLNIVVNLTLNAPFSIGIYGGPDTFNSALFTKYKGLLEDDWEYFDTGLGRVPFSVTVLFHKKYQYYGTEETVRRDSLQWTSTPAYKVVVPGPYSVAQGTTTLWADINVLYDVDGNPLAADVATANTVAAALAANYYARITRSTQGFMRRRYVGALPFATGGLVDGVAWRETFNEKGELGWTTLVVRGDTPAFPEVM